MKPSELYAMTPARTDGNLYALSRHVPEVDFSRIEEEELPSIRLNYYADENFDGERGWALFVVVFQATPVMICQKAGRGNWDYKEQYITDGPEYQRMVRYLENCYAPTDVDTSAYDPDQDVEDLTTFHGNTLTDFYDPDLMPAWKEGDVVAALVPVNHLRNRADKVLTRVRIRSVNKFNPRTTYLGDQLDRRWGDDTPPDWSKNPIVDVGNGQLGCSLTDADIQGPVERPV